MTRSAEDIALLLQVIAGYDPADPGSEDCPVPDFAAALGRRRRGLRLGLIEGWHDAPGAHPDLGAGHRRQRSPCCEHLGAIVEPVKLSSLRDYTDCKTTISSVELLHDPRAGSAHPAAGFRPHPAQPRAARRADPRPRITRPRCAGAPRSPRSRHAAFATVRCARHRRRARHRRPAPTRQPGPAGQRAQHHDAVQRRRACRRSPSPAASARPRACRCRCRSPPRHSPGNHWCCASPTPISRRPTGTAVIPTLAESRRDAQRPQPSATLDPGRNPRDGRPRRRRLSTRR